MNFAVVWDAEAVDDIEQAWRTASEVEQNRIYAAVDTINTALEKQPMSVGESRDVRTRRVMVGRTLTVYYDVQERQQIVRVVAANVYRKSD